MIGPIAEVYVREELSNIIYSCDVQGEEIDFLEVNDIEISYIHHPNYNLRERLDHGVSRLALETDDGLVDLCYFSRAGDLRFYNDPIFNYFTSNEPDMMGHSKHKSNKRQKLSKRVANNMKQFANYPWKVFAVPWVADASATLIGVGLFSKGEGNEVAKAYMDYYGTFDGFLISAGVEAALILGVNMINKTAGKVVFYGTMGLHFVAALGWCSVASGVESPIINNIMHFTRLGANLFYKAFY
jgi:hypothetical protein